MRGRTPSEGRFVGTGSAHVALTIGSRALGASEPRQVRKEAALRTPSQVPRLRPIRAGDADTSGDTDLDDGARGRAIDSCRRRRALRETRRHAYRSVAGRSASRAQRIRARRARPTSDPQRLVASDHRAIPQTRSSSSASSDVTGRRSRLRARCEAASSRTDARTTATSGAVASTLSPRAATVEHRATSSLRAVRASRQPMTLGRRDCPTATSSISRRLSDSHDSVARSRAVDEESIGASRPRRASFESPAAARSARLDEGRIFVLEHALLMLVSEVVVRTGEQFESTRARRERWPAACRLRQSIGRDSRRARSGSSGVGSMPWRTGRHVTGLPRELTRSTSTTSAYRRPNDRASA